MAKLKPIHPGEILREEFVVPLKLNGNKLALALRVAAPQVYDILSEKGGISAEMAIRLGQFFNMSPEFWMNLQSQYELAVLRQTEEKKIRDEVQPMVVGA
jgi:addiction module HigA family antidote